MATHASETARDRVLRSASELFYAHGFHAVGVDLIIERAGVAKATFYRHFPTKDDLIVAYLHSSHEKFWAWFESSIDANAAPADALMGLFDAVAALAGSPACLGCTFQVTAAEFPDRAHPGHAVALAHKRDVRARLHELAVAARASRPGELADGLLLLMDGAFASTRMYGHRKSPGASVASVAHTLVAAHAGGSRRGTQ